MQNYGKIVRDAASHHLSAPVIANVRYFQNVGPGFAVANLLSSHRLHDAGFAPRANCDDFETIKRDEATEQSEELKDRWVASHMADYESFFFQSLCPVIEFDSSRVNKDDFAHFLDMRKDNDPNHMARTLSTRPSVYIVYFHNTNDSDNPQNRPWTVYVGETNHIIKRTVQHVGKPGTDDSGTGTAEERKSRQRRETGADRCITNAIKNGIEVRQFVIWQELFNKSLTLDIENKLIDYMHTIPTVNCLNGRTNPQGSYFTRDALDAVVSKIWGKLTADNDEVAKIQKHVERSQNLADFSKALPNLLPTEEHIWQSSLYKISPFHRLGQGQHIALEEIKAKVKSVIDNWGRAYHESQLIMVEGAAGTGKSILLSTLFYELANMTDSPKTRVKLLIYNKELLRQYTEMAKLQGIFKTDPENQNDKRLSDNIANVCGPSSFIHGLTPCEKIETPSGKIKPDYAHPIERCDVVLVDEAHLLFTQGRQGYQGVHQLFDVLRRAKVVIAVFDPNQIMNNTQRWDTEQLETFLERAGAVGDSRLHAEQALTSENQDAYPPMPPTNYQVFSLRLSEQFRISASKDIEKWIRSFGTGLSNKIVVDDMSPDRKPRILPIPEDDLSRENGVFSEHSDWPFEIRVCDSPFEVEKMIESAQKKMRRQASLDAADSKTTYTADMPNDLCRMLATYDWRYTAAKGGYVTLYPRADGTWAMPAGWTDDNRPIEPEGTTGAPFHRSWNDNVMENPVSQPNVRSGNERKSQKGPWATREETKNEIGSYFTIQGSDLNYAGVIIGPSIGYDLENDHVVYYPSLSKDNKLGSDEQLQEVFVKNQLNVLLTRGIHGLYLFAVDANLQKKLKEAQTMSTLR